MLREITRQQSIARFIRRLRRATLDHNQPARDAVDRAAFLLGGLDAAARLVRDGEMYANDLHDVGQRRQRSVPQIFFKLVLAAFRGAEAQCQDPATLPDTERELHPADSA